VHSWTEYWYPVKHLDGAFVEATKQIAINVRFLATTKPKGNIQISISSTETINNATVALSIDGGRTKTFRLSFDPQNARAILIPVDDIATAESSAAVDIVGEAGRTLLHWRASDPIDGNSELAIPANVSPTHDSAAHDRGAEELFLQSALDERQGNRARAQQTLNELLKRDPNNIPVLLKLAIQHDRDGDFRTAEGYIDRAIRLDDSDPVLQYAAGVIYRGAGRMDSAQDAFWASIRLGGPSPQSFLQLGEIALSRRDYEEAERLLRKALLYNPDDALAQCDLAVALRLRGKVSQAGKIAAEAVNMMPLYPVALAERWRIAAVGTPHSTSALTSEHEWGRAVGGRMQNYTEAGSWYWSLHDYISSDFILKTAVQHFAADQISPMIYYYLASNARHEGLQLRATEFSALARKARYDVLFPNRTSDAAVLQEALVANPTDSHAQYFLGTFLFQHGSYDEAAQLWKKAAEADFQYSVLYRDLGLYAWRVKMDYKEASTYFLKAIRLAPLDYHLYVDMDEVDAHEGSTEARETLFANAPSSVVDHDAARIRYCAFLIGAGQAEKALNLLKTHNFKPWEQGQDVHALFVAANILAGRQALAAKRFEDAETDFRYAFEYPRNLGVAKPDKPNDAAARYWLAQAQYEQGDKEAAHREWQRLLDEASGNALSQYYGALALEGLGEAAEAKRQMTVLAEGPARGRTNANDYYVAGLAERQRQREPQAIADFEKALEINPFYWQAENEMKH
jgi:tetratricopeptide (TPR) repeat protein